jgi:hypothetical protein
VDLSTLSAVLSTDTILPLSPLFFSHTSRCRPDLPPTFSSSEAVATVLNQSREKSGGITTLKLARGSISSTSPPRSVSTLGSWMSFSQEHSPNLQDIEADPAVLQLLIGVGVLELLEQDDRPTFVIDLENETNYNPGTLKNLVYQRLSTSV